MAKDVCLTFRDQTTGRINDLLSDEHRPCAQSQNLLSFLAGALLNYTEEGVEFTPSVILCDSLANVLQAFPGAVAYAIGTAPLDPSSGPRILKDCVPLSSRSWFVFIERRTDGQVNYGVFTYLRMPTAIALHEAITINTTEFCILVRKLGVNTIEMRGAKGSRLELIFSTVREPISASSPVETFAACCCGDLPNDQHKADFRVYLTRLLEGVLSSSHGAILVCAKDLQLASVQEMQDAVALQPPLDLRASFSALQAGHTAEALLSLQVCEELLAGLLRCDGIVIFDTAGRVTAYHAFFRPTGSPGAGGAAEVVEGARRRAFEGIKNLVGKDNAIRWVLFRSQDGQTLHHGGE